MRQQPRSLGSGVQCLEYAPLQAVVPAAGNESARLVRYRHCLQIQCLGSRLMPSYGRSCELARLAHRKRPWLAGLHRRPGCRAAEGVQPRPRGGEAPAAAAAVAGQAAHGEQRKVCQYSSGLLCCAVLCCALL